MTFFQCNRCFLIIKSSHFNYGYSYKKAYYLVYIYWEAFKVTKSWTVNKCSEFVLPKDDNDGKVMIEVTNTVHCRSNCCIAAVLRPEEVNSIPSPGEWSEPYISQGVNRVQADKPKRVKRIFRLSIVLCLANHI